MNNPRNSFMNITQALDELVAGPPAQSLSPTSIIPSAPPRIETHLIPDVFNPLALTVDIPNVGVEGHMSQQHVQDVGADIRQHLATEMAAAVAALAAADGPVFGEFMESDTDSDVTIGIDSYEDPTAVELFREIGGSGSRITSGDFFGADTRTTTHSLVNENDNISGSADTRNTSTQMPLEKRECTVCYNFFGIDKIVNTRCGHVYCSDCFFRWLKGNVTCAMCRKNFTSWRRHSRDQLNDDISAVTDMFNSSLKKHVYLSRCNTALMTNNTKLLCEKDTLMKSLIRSRELIDFNRGYAQGLLSIFRPKYTGNSQEYDRGLMKGYEEFKDTVKKNRENKRKEENRGYIKIPGGKIRKRESNLFVFHGTD
jgi:hypothetical protein